MGPTSFLDLTRVKGVARIEIPIIQRDYAQGRHGRETDRIRAAFLSVLHGAATGNAYVHLDFIYGEVNGNVLVPLDGQQRLTALFLLHWYVAARAGAGVDRIPPLTYATRYSSRLFCSKLLEQHPFPLDEGQLLSDWLRDRSWFVRVWRHDPTIESMLVVLDDIHMLFKDEDCQAIWARLADQGKPVITFHFQAISDFGLTDDLYIKMNSRGKPLTPFEGFKAEFEDIVRGSSEARHTELCSKIDNEWSDVLWKERDESNTIDDEFLAYLRFVMETRAALLDKSICGDELDQARQLFGADNAENAANLEFLFDAFDVWTKKPPETAFKDAFTSFGHAQDKVALFEQETNLFRSCCRGGSLPIWKHLLLYALFQHLRDGSPDFPRRLRMLRNLALNSQAEFRESELPTVLQSTEKLISAGELAQLEGFNATQLGEEKRKVEVLAKHPELAPAVRELEDHSLLRGSVASLDLDPDTFEHRATVFQQIFSGSGGAPVEGTGAAVLACGDYSYQNRSGKFQFGNDRRELWRDLLQRRRARDVLRRLLDQLDDAEDVPIGERLRSVVETYLATQQQLGAFDWRYYLVKYPEMRGGKSGLYTGTSDSMGFSLCMLEKTTLNSWYQDPYLLAICNKAAVDKTVEVSGPWFKGHQYGGRWLIVSTSGTAIRTVSDGWELRPPTDDAFDRGFQELCASHAVDSENVLRVPQTTIDRRVCDTKDRIEAGARLLRDLVDLTPH